MGQIGCVTNPWGCGGRGTDRIAEGRGFLERTAVRGGCTLSYPPECADR
jgi:hypothetical protein